MKSIIKKEIKDGPINHPRIAECYADVSEKRDTAVVRNRKEGALLAQLRTGHCMKLAHYEHRVKPDVSEICVRCGEEPDDVVHWLTNCPQTSAARQSIFGRTDLDLRDMGTSPEGVLELARRTLM